jgi:hypothetical protein
MDPHPFAATPQKDGVSRQSGTLPGYTFPQQEQEMRPQRAQFKFNITIVLMISNEKDHRN